MSMTEARKRANKKYDDSHYKSINLKVRNDKKDIIDKVAQEKNIPVATFCRLCIEYCIKNNIDISNNSDNG